MSQKPVLTTIEAADFLGYDEATLRMSRTTGKLAGIKPPPHIKRGTMVRYWWKDLVAWLEGDESGD